MNDERDRDAYLSLPCLLQLFLFSKRSDRLPLNPDCDRLTTADISLYRYTHVADESGFDLTHYPAIRAWLERVASEPNYIGMT